MESIKRFLPEAHIIEYKEQGLVEYLGYKCFEPAAFLDLNSWRISVISTDSIANDSTCLTYRPSREKYIAQNPNADFSSMLKEVLRICLLVPLLTVFSATLYFPGLLIGTILTSLSYFSSSKQHIRCLNYIKERRQLVNIYNRLVDIHKELTQKLRPYAPKNVSYVKKESGIYNIENLSYDKEQLNNQQVLEAFQNGLFTPLITRATTELENYEKHARNVFTYGAEKVEHGRLLILKNPADFLFTQNSLIPQIAHQILYGKRCVNLGLVGINQEPLVAFFHTLNLSLPDCTTPFKEAYQKCETLAQSINDQFQSYDKLQRPNSMKIFPLPTECNEVMVQPFVNYSGKFALFDLVKSPKE